VSGVGQLYDDVKRCGYFCNFWIDDAVFVDLNKNSPIPLSLLTFIIRVYPRVSHSPPSLHTVDPQISKSFHSPAPTNLFLLLSSHKLEKMSVVGLDFGNQNAVIAAAGRGGVDVILNGNSNRLNA